MKKVGLFFGTFDPIHNGHLTLANHFASESDLDSVWFVITPQNPFKLNFKMLPNENRLELVRLAIKGSTKLDVSTVEFDLPTPNYTYDTLTHLENKYPEIQFALLMGEDNMVTFQKWKQYQSILDRFELYVYPRKTQYSIPVEFKKHPKIKWTEAPLVEITSTDIRNRIQQGKEIKSNLPIEVWNCILKKGFYSN